MRPGEVFGLVGPDGAGKTTILRLLAAVMTPDEGATAIDGVDVVDGARDWRSSHFSYMPQRFGLDEDLTVDENICVFTPILFDIQRNVREERGARLLQASGMEPFRSRRAGQLSGGMKQKLGLVLLPGPYPQVLLLDEPTPGVDPVSRRDFWRILYGSAGEGVTILIATAYLDEAERCTRLGLLQCGRMLDCDTPTRPEGSDAGRPSSRSPSYDPRSARDRPRPDREGRQQRDSDGRWRACGGG